MIVHIGGAKCASTYLQTSVLNKIRGYNFYGRGSKITEDLQKYCLGRKEKYEHIIEEKSILSHEGLSILKNNKGHHISKNIRSAIGEATIIYIIRNQKQWLRSRYSQDMKMYMGEKTKYYDFEDWLKGEFHKQLEDKTTNQATAYTPKERIKYDNIYSSYEDTFRNVCVIPMELLQDNVNKFIKKVENVVGNDIDYQGVNKKK